MDAYLLHILGEFMGMPVVSKHSKYLGLPLIIGRNRCDAFRALEEKMRKKIQDWKTVLLSSAGKEALIKSCLQSTPIYAMSCYKVPKTLCDRFASLAIKYWWTGNGKEWSIHWLSKDVLQLEKEKGGLGFRCFQALNLALLMKQLWRFLDEPDQLVCQVYRDKYFKECGLLNSRARPYDSYVWKCLNSVIDCLKWGLIFDQRQQKWRWKESVLGEFTVKSAYGVARNWLNINRRSLGESSTAESMKPLWRKFWKINLPDRIKILVWRLFHDALPVAENLKRRGCEIETGCCFCGYMQETAKHLFINCWWSRAMWDRLNIEEWPVEAERSIADWVWHFIADCRLATLRKIMVGAWVIWYNRNLLNHGKAGQSLDWCCNRVKALLAQFENKSLLGQSFVTGPSGGAGGGIRVFCDGSWSYSSTVGGLAAVAIGESDVLACCVKWLPNCTSSLEVECLALLNGMLMAEEMGWERVIFYSDSSRAIWATQGGAWETLQIAGASARSLGLFQSHRKWEIAYSMRECNEAADLLAKRARRERWCWENLMAVPRCLQSYSVQRSLMDVL